MYIFDVTVTRSRILFDIVLKRIVVES